MIELDDTDNAVASEIEALHRFFVMWFSGSVSNTGALFQNEFMDRFDPGAMLIPPNGSTVALHALASSIRSGYGANPEFRIAIRNVAVRRKWDKYVLATYEEWQRNAQASTPPDNGRVATVVFEAGNRLKWIHIHETWLPEEIMAAGPYDF